MRPPLLKSESGQFITEAVLILVTLMAISALVANHFKQNEVFKKLIKGPWVQLSGVLQNGVWASPEDGGVSHPNATIRHIVIQGDK
jgi:hypothetical protein